MARCPRCRRTRCRTPETTCISPRKRSASSARTRRAIFRPATSKTLTAYKKALDLSTKFIPIWVKICVALALGLGTMIGWKRIVVTVGEKIGKEHLNYGQGAAAELVAMARSSPPTTSACRSRRRTSSRPASPARWRPTARACSSHVAQYRDGLGADAALRDRAVGVALLDLPPHFLSTKTFLNAKPALPPGPAFLFAAFGCASSSCRLRPAND